LEVPGIVVPESDWRRYVKRVRQLEDSSTAWLSAAWAVTGISATLAVGAATIPERAIILGIMAGLCALGCLGCFLADRDVNRRRGKAAEELALEMKEAAGID
jgi:hypothetical protein